LRQKKLTLLLVSGLILALMASLTGCLGFGDKPQTQNDQKEQIAGKATPKNSKIEEKAPGSFASEPTIKVYIKETGQIERMPLEKYLEGVVAGEMKNDWPVQALAAQAVLARTFTMEILSRKKGKFKGGADISTDIEEAQAYNADAVNSKVRRAVRMTKGQVALYKGKYIHAWYFSSAGGITATAKEGLAYPGAEPGYIKVIKTPEENRVLPPEKKRWADTFSGQEVEKALLELGQDVGSLKSIAIAQKGPSGRADLIRIKGSKGSAEVKGAELRIRLGSEKMKSLLLNRLEVTGGKVVMGGRGFGHGVGMSQYGAYGLAKENKNYDYILKRYFKNITLKRLWE